MGYLTKRYKLYKQSSLYDYDEHFQMKMLSQQIRWST